MSIRTDIAKAMLAEIDAAVAAGTFGSGIVTTRAYEPLYDLPDPALTYFTIVAKSYAAEPQNRSTTEVTVEVDVAIQAKVASAEPAEIDPLADLVEDVIDYLVKRRLAAFPLAAPMGVTNRLLYIYEHLKNTRLFTSVITLQYRAHTKED
jgi:hypothetical protein